MSASKKNEDKQRKITCHICKEKFLPAQVEAKYLPFCSKKCKLIDLGKWFSEDYNIIKD